MGRYLTHIRRIPFVYVVWRKRNIYLGMAVHMLLNGISTTLTIVAVTSELA